VTLARAIKEAPSLRYSGVQFYCGREQHVPSFEERREKVMRRFDYLKTVLAALADAGAPASVVTGGGTGTHVIDAELGLLTELQAGSYVFMDRQYLDCEILGQGAEPFATSLFIDSSVISANAEGMATIDAGFKAMATDGGLPAIHAGAPPDSNFLFMGDEHGAIKTDTVKFKLGDRVVLTAPHCDPTVNLYDYYHVVQGNTLVAVWPVSARGRSR
jgi:D-serine deaminase-like pyridoxal phosphate-dependent protein